MKARCPKCDAPFELEQAVRDQAQQDLLEEIRRLGPRAGLVLEYLEGFKTGPGLPLRVATALRLTREIRALIESGAFSYDHVGRHGSRSPYRLSRRGHGAHPVCERIAESHG